MQSTQSLCEQCGDIIHGPGKGGEMVRKTHVYVRGVISLSSYRPSAKKWRFAYVTRGPEEEHHFCNFKCLAKYAQERDDDFTAATVNAPNMPHSDPMGKVNHRGD